MSDLVYWVLSDGRVIQELLPDMTWMGLQPPNPEWKSNVSKPQMCPCGHKLASYNAGSCPCGCHTQYEVKKDMVSIGGGGSGNPTIDKIKHNVSISNLAFSIDMVGPSVIDMDTLLTQLNVKYVSLEDLGNGQAWLILEKLPKRVDSVRVPPYWEDTPITNYTPKRPKDVGVKSKDPPKEPQVPFYVGDAPKPADNTKEDPMAWTKELDTPPASDHLFDISHVNPVKLFINRLIYKIRTWGI